MKTSQTSPAGPLSRVFLNFRGQRMRARDARVIEQLPDRIRKDIGWPPYGDLDERAGY